MRLIVELESHIYRVRKSLVPMISNVTNNARYLDTTYHLYRRQDEATFKGEEYHGKVEFSSRLIN